MDSGDLSNGKGEGISKSQERTASRYPYNVPCVTRNILAVNGHISTNAFTPQNSVDILDNLMMPLSEKFVQNELEAVRNPSMGHCRQNGSEGQVSYVPLTTRILDEHNLQQQSTPRVPDSYNTSQYSDFTFRIAAAGVIPRLDVSRHGITRDGTENFKSSSVEDPLRTEIVHCSSLDNEADQDASKYQSSSRWQPQSVYQDDDTEMLAPDLFDVDPRSWDTSSGRELAGWGNDLAGIGEHLVDFTC